MQNWNCPVDSIDEDIREVVRILYENNMKPYMSCSGSYKDHEGGKYVPKSACVEMLDSELTRELMANLINDKRFKCSISKESARTFYDNQLPTGFRFKIDFENICGDTSKDLQSVLQEIVNGRKTNTQDRRKIDAVCELVDSFDVSRGNDIVFSFNDEMINPEGTDGYNYSVSISDKKDFEVLKSDFGDCLDGFMQNEYESRFWGNDYITMLAFLKKVGIEYAKIPILKNGQKAKSIVDSSRIDKFMSLYNEKSRQARLNMEKEANERLFQSEQVNDFEALFEMYEK